MVHFGEYELDVARRELRRAGEPVHLEPQAFDLLAVLVAHADEVVTKEQLLDGVWGHRFLSEANITTRVKEIRAALGDDGRAQHTIRNVRGRGYRFVRPIVAAAVADVHHGLVGRDDVLEALLGLVAGARVVTLTGPGGVGKSSLARAVAALAAPRHRDGAHVVELAPIDRGDLVLPTVARALDVVLDRDRPELALRPLARLDALVVLDNCEHVADDVLALLDRLVTAPDAAVRVVATSQVRLGLSDEQVVPLDPLRPLEAVALFEQRARAVRAAWRADDVGRERVLGLLDRLDRLPLAIEIAAARLGSMTFDDLEAALQGTMPLARMTHRAPSPRHRSLDALTRWSAGLLDDGTRRTLTELSVFAGSFDAADAAAVVSDGHAAAAHLAELADRSLLVVDLGGRRTRYRLLTTVRAVAARWSDEAAGPAAQARHARHLVAVADEVDRGLRTPEEAAARARLAAIQADIRVAHQWAARHDPVSASALSGALHLAAYSTFWNEPADWSVALLGDHPGADAGALAGARVTAAGRAAHRGDLVAARAWLDPLSGAAVDPRWRAAAVEILSDVAIYAGELDVAHRHVVDLRQLAHETGDRHALAMAAVNETLALVFGGRADGAQAPLDDVGGEELGPSDRAWLAYARGEVHAERRDGLAAACFAEAITVAGAAGNPFVVSVARMSLATEHARAGRPAEALAAFARCLRDYQRHGNFVHAVACLRSLVSVLVAVGDDHGAAVVGAAATRPDLRPSYGAESAELARVLDELADRGGPDRFATWCAEGAALELDRAVQWAGRRLPDVLA